MTDLERFTLSQIRCLYPDYRKESILKILNDPKAKNLSSEFKEELRELLKKTRNELSEQSIHNDFVPEEFCNNLEKVFAEVHFRHSFKINDKVIFKKNIKSLHTSNCSLVERPYIVIHCYEEPKPILIPEIGITHPCNLLIGTIKPNNEETIVHTASYLIESYIPEKVA